MSELRALRYMTRFKCIAERCEDTCCAGLKIPLTEEGYRRLQGAMASTEAERLRFSRGVSLNLKGLGGPHHAFIAKREQDACPFLDVDRLCSVHRDHGEALLPDICSLFPRVLTRVGERLELAGSLACPEVARLCLLAEDGVERVPVPADTLPRQRPTQQLTRPPSDPYGRFFDEVREAACRILGLRQYPLASRLLMLGHLGHQLGPYYHRGVKAWDEATSERLRGELASAADPAQAEAIHRGLGSVELSAGACLTVVLSMLRARLQLAHSERFARFAEALGASYRASLAPGAASPEPQGLWLRFTTRRRRVQAAFSERVEQYFHNYSVHFWYRHAYTESPSVLAHVFALVLRLAVIQLAWVGHPELEAALKDRSPEAARERADRAAVEVFQLVTKNLHQSEPFEAALAQGLSGSDADVFGRLMLFARVC